MLIRLDHAVKKSGAAYVILDAFDTLFSSFSNSGEVRSQIFKVFNYCKSQGITLLASAGIAPNYLESTDVLDYASDCTILLSQQLSGGADDTQAACIEIARPLTWHQ